MATGGSAASTSEILLLYAKDDVLEALVVIGKQGAQAPRNPQQAVGPSQYRLACLVHMQQISIRCQEDDTYSKLVKGGERKLACRICVAKSLSNLQRSLQMRQQPGQLIDSGCLECPGISRSMHTDDGMVATIKPDNRAAKMVHIHSWTQEFVVDGTPRQQVILDGLTS
ncbi:MAG: hypothetical protein B7Y08_14795 [Rhodospirillales bacterium 24-66-33]|nr:MAG: hypothetical protein B7Y57_12150 [Rhodospirillales bacterium 35-66-84]OYZ94040.1 MAG: hypothetical protein B7Y08_14795 [Rhodospirillales bacterium 24-66-33]OZB22311.1 MAG: hypothetical protein B7X63_23045 [Rhodospirillales bacterium 39-66-50]